LHWTPQLPSPWSWPCAWFPSELVLAGVLGPPRSNRRLLGSGAEILVRAVTISGMVGLLSGNSRTHLLATAKARDKRFREHWPCSAGSTRLAIPCSSAWNHTTMVKASNRKRIKHTSVYHAKTWTLVKLVSILSLYPFFRVLMCKSWLAKRNTCCGQEIGRTWKKT
jgi:hypothetical protein